MTRYVAVIGPAQGDADAEAIAEKAGTLLAEAGAIVVCGGLGGVMEAVCRGAASAGGITVGLLPGSDRRDANRYVTVAIPTGLGEARNAMVAGSADAVIAIGGGFGTLSEIGLALKKGIPVYGINTWELSRRGAPADGIHRVSDAATAVRLALE